MLFKENTRNSSAFSADVVRFGTARTRALLDALGSPDLKTNIVHVAGTNGKGSVCASLASVLREAGYRTGSFFSPAVLFPHETVRIDGCPVPEETYLRLRGEVDAVADKMSDVPTAFERETALALLAFAESGCDFSVLECGLGGRDDATNAVARKELAVITSVALDHTRELGDTLTEVARAKAGIIKGRAVSAPQCSEVARVIYPLCTAVAVAPPRVEVGADGTLFDYDCKQWKTALCGRHQAVNSAVVIEAASQLRKAGFAVPEAALRSGLENVVHHARFEVLKSDNVVNSPYHITVPRGKTLVLDGAHNPHGARALAETLEDVFGEGKVAAVFGVLADKDVAGIAGTLAPRFCRVLTVTPPSARALDAEAAKNVFDRAADALGELVPTDTARGVREGVERLLSDYDTVVVCGSLTLFSELARG